MRRLSLLLLPLLASTSIASAGTPVTAAGELTLSPPIALAPLAAPRALARPAKSVGGDGELT